MKIMTMVILLLVGSVLNAQDVKYWDSIRNSQYEWTCEEQDGTVLSGHTRSDKAEVACSNRTLLDGVERVVRSGTYRIVRLKELPTEPPVEPPVDPPVEPPVDPPIDTPQVTFGPVTAITQYPNTISAIAQDEFRWEITFTLNQTAGTQGLASRDENGQTDPGHLGVWVNEGLLTVRHQDTSQSIQIQAQTLIVAGVEYVATVSVEAGVGIGLFLDGELEASSVNAFGLMGNSLPLTLGGLCSRCNDPNDATQGPDREIDGIVSMAIYDDPLELPVPIVGSALLTWTPPTHYEDCDGTEEPDSKCSQPLEPEYPDRIDVYSNNPRSLVATLDGEAIMYEVANLNGGEHCFIATAFAGQGNESEDSNVACKVVE